MSAISVTTVTTGQTITAGLWNDSFSAIVDDYNGNITNANISASAGISASKISFGGTSGQVLKSDGSGGLTYGGAGRGFTWGVVGTLTVADEQGMKYVAPQGFTVTKLWAKTTSGTCDIRVQTDTTTIGTLSVTSSVGSTTSFSSTSISAGQVVTLDITAVSSGVDLYVTLEMTQS